jgi:hypothetical protein
MNNNIFLHRCPSAFLFLLYTVLVTLPLSVRAESKVYKSVDKNGIPSYFSQKPNESAKPADLPPIMRERMGPKPIQLTSSCTSHGGISCENGIDTDGSVICSDGFKDAAARFQFRCEVTKLTMTEVSPPSVGGDLKVWIRNEKDIQAKDVSVSVKNADGALVTAEGPPQIAPSELAEYTFHNLQLNKAYSSEEVDISCANCG